MGYASKTDEGEKLFNCYVCGKIDLFCAVQDRRSRLTPLHLWTLLIDCGFRTNLHPLI